MQTSIYDFREGLREGISEHAWSHCSHKQRQAEAPMASHSVIVALISLTLLHRPGVSHRDGQGKSQQPSLRSRKPRQICAGEADANGAQQYANHDGKYSLNAEQRVATHNLSKKTLSIPTYSSPKAASRLSSRISFRDLSSHLGLKLSITPPERKGGLARGP
jgi:hypothetical protein